MVSDPLAVDGFTDAPPDKNYPPVIIAEYQLGNDEPRVRCSYCEQRQHHRRGFVVEFAPGCRHLVGSNCGVQKLDLSFKAAKRSHKELKDRQHVLLRLNRAYEKYDELISHCDMILRGPELGEIQSRAVLFQRSAREAYIRLGSLATSGSALTEEVKVRDYAEEQRRDEMLPEGQKGDPIYRFETAQLGPFQGAALFNPKGLQDHI